MTEPTAFRATYADWKLIRTRQTVQVVFEIPLSDADAAYTVLGGMPDSAREHWFGIAPINLSPAAEKEKTATPRSAPQPTMTGAKRDKRDWRDIPPPQQAGIRCADPIFGAFLKEQFAEDWQEGAADPAECVRLICGVVTRTQLLDGAHRVIWKQLDDKFQAWARVDA